MLTFFCIPHNFYILGKMPRFLTKSHLSFSTTFGVYTHPAIRMKDINCFKNYLCVFSKLKLQKCY